MDLIIYGTGGHAKVVADAARRQSQYRLIGFVDERATRENYLECPVAREPDVFSGACFVVAIGDNRIRREEYLKLIQKGWQAAVIVHPDAVVAEDVELGDGTVVFAGTVINAGTRIGVNCIVNTGATIDHDCLVGSHVHVAPGCHLAGGVSVGDGSLLGIGTVTVLGVSIGSWVTTGAGAVVIRSIESDVTVVGVPARQLK